MSNMGYQNIDKYIAPGYHSDGRSVGVLNTGDSAADAAGLDVDILICAAGEKIYVGNAVYIKEVLVTEEVRYNIIELTSPLNGEVLGYGVIISGEQYLMWYDDNSYPYYWITINGIDYPVQGSNYEDRWIMYPEDLISNRCFNQIVNISIGIDYYTTIGISLDEKESGEDVRIQYRGILDYTEIIDDFNGFGGLDSQLVVCDEKTKNITNELEMSYNVYDRFIILGDIIYQNNLLINIREYING